VPATQLFGEQLLCYQFMLSHYLFDNV